MWSFFIFSIVLLCSSDLRSSFPLVISSRSNLNFLLDFFFVFSIVVLPSFMFLYNHNGARKQINIFGSPSLLKKIVKLFIIFNFVTYTCYFIHPFISTFIKKCIFVKELFCNFLHYHNHFSNKCIRLHQFFSIPFNCFYLFSRWSAIFFLFCFFKDVPKGE